MRSALIGISLLAAGTADAQENVFPRMVGKWRELNTATTVLIQPDGSVFAAGSPIYGQAQRSITGGGNFAFENEKAQCVYDIVLLQDDTTASWGLRSESINDPTVAKGYCLPRGHFVRIETSAEAEQRRVDAARKERDRLARLEAERLEANRIERQRQARIEAEQQEALRIERERQARLEAERIERERRAELARKDAERQQYLQVAGECDRLAASPDDKDRPEGVPGVAWREVNIYAKEAVKACGEALKIYVDHPRLIYQMGRAMQFVKPERALKLLAEAAWKHGYPAAYDNLGSIYRDGKHTSRDLPKAMSLFRKGAQLGDSSAMYSLAYMLLRDPNAQQEGFEWLKKSASLRYEPAIRLLGEYQAQLAAYQQQQQHYRQQPIYPQQGRIPPEAQMMLNLFGGILRGR